MNPSDSSASWICGLHPGYTTDTLFARLIKNEFWPADGRDSVSQSYATNGWVCLLGIVEYCWAQVMHDDGDDGDDDLGSMMTYILSDDEDLQLYS